MNKIDSINNNFLLNQPKTIVIMSEVIVHTESKKDDYENRYVYDVYESIADHFSSTRTYQWGWIKSFMAGMPLQASVLDIGCGNGRNMKFYTGHNMKGIDTCSKFVHMCRKDNLDVVRANMCDIPYDNNSFDALLVIASFHHLEHEIHRIKALEEMYRILKEGGNVLLSVWSKEQPTKTRRKFDKYGHNLVPWTQLNGTTYQRYYYIFQKDELKKLIEQTGFTIHSWNWECGNEVLILTK